MLIFDTVHKVFGAGTVNEKTAINGVNFTLHESDFVTIIGGNGAGKSTVLNAIAGVFGVEKGKILIDGKDVTKLPEHSRAPYIGRVFQDPRMGTAENMTIEENLAIAYRRGKKRTLRWGTSRREREVFYEHLKGLNLGLENRMKAKAGVLSGGQRQALTLLMATIQKPLLLLLDEHTAALDPKTAKTVLEVTNRVISENNLTALMVTHNMKDALKTGNRLIMMHDGAIISDVKGKEKQNLTVAALLEMFEQSGLGEEVLSDRMLLG